MTVLRSMDLKTWEAIGGVTGGEDGRSEFVDTNPPPTQAYYRVSFTLKDREVVFLLYRNGELISVEVAWTRRQGY